MPPRLPCDRRSHHRRWLQCFLFALLMLLCFSASAVERSFTLVYSGNLDGELEPCGCSEAGDLGGLRRRATLIHRLRTENPHMALISAGGLLHVEGAGDRLKSEYILSGFRQLEYDAVGVQWGDLAFGPEFIFGAGLPWVASNWLDDEMVVSRRISRGGVRLAFFDWLDPAASPLRQMKGERRRVADDPAQLHEELRKAKKDGVLTILATTLSAEQAASRLGLQDVDILIQRAAYEKYGKPLRLGDTLVLQPGSRGMSLGRLDLRVAEGRIVNWQHQVLPMPDSMPNAPSMADWYAAYNAAVKAAYLKRVEIRKQRESGQSPFVGEEVCASCHAQQHAVWADSDHAVAYDDLEAVGKSFDPECIQCHTVGFERPGGFIDMKLTPHLLGVQCETCHGAGRKHAESAGKAALANAGWTPQRMCAQCHTQPHSPGFDFATYWPKIRH